MKLSMLLVRNVRFVMYFVLIRFASERRTVDSEKNSSVRPVKVSTPVKVASPVLLQKSPSVIRRSPANVSHPSSTYKMLMPVVYA
jgi:hypothetical protein